MFMRMIGPYSVLKSGGTCRIRFESPAGPASPSILVQADLAPGHFHFHFSCSLHWKIVPYVYRITVPYPRSGSGLEKSRKRQFCLLKI
eukprot:COSAG02_NODE_396_length_23126_cov_282.150258_27_plen_88_part_00